MPILNPLVYVKLVCHQCGQKYAFDVLPEDNRMPTAVKCPVCRADGTPAANQFLAKRLMPSLPQPTVPTGATAPVAAAVPATPVVSSDPAVSSVVKVPHVSMGLGAPVFPAGNGANAAADEEWRRRALEAEARAEKAQAALRASLAPQLAEFVKEAVVQGLAAQRGELLNAHRSAALEVSELVHRLDELKMPMQERQQAYEARIKELERDLAERNEENRELLKLQIELTRHQLETERARGVLSFN